MQEKSFLNQSEYNFDDLLKIMEMLRGENGCPWDKTQTHQSIANNVVEEAWEVVDTINKKDDKMLKNELGDLLLQVIFHGQIAKERETFNIDDILFEVCNKLVTRHTHIFGEDIAENSEAALDTWEQNKAKEKHLTTVTESMNDVPFSFPALMRAEKIQKKASKSGFSNNNINFAIDKAYKKVVELNEVIDSSNVDSLQEALGELLFAVVNIGRVLKISNELALNSSTNNFVNKFSYIERAAINGGKALSEISLEEMDKL